MNVDDSSTSSSLVASFHESISAPVTPLVEPIQSVISSIQTTSEKDPLKTTYETIDRSQDEISLDTEIMKELKDIHDDETQINEVR